MGIIVLYIISFACRLSSIMFMVSSMFLDQALYLSHLDSLIFL